jgi:hypothetical protein
MGERSGGCRSYLAFRFDPEAFMPAAEFSDPLNQLLFNTT